MIRKAIAVAAVAVGALALACAGGPRPLPERLPTLCEADRLAQPPSATEWLGLLLRGYDPETHRATSPALDCTDTQVRWDGPALACDDAPGRGALPSAPLTDADVLVSPLSKDASLVWIATTRYATGDALGPVALVASSGRRQRVKALGALRAYPHRASLRLENLGGDDVLVAEGDTCAPGSPGATCGRVARLLVLRGGRFIAEPFRGDGGRCVSPGVVELSRRDRQRTGMGWESRELVATMTFGAGGLVIDEQFTVSALGDKAGAAPPRLLDRAQATRTVRWVDGRLVTSAAPLWTRMTGR